MRAAEDADSKRPGGIRDRQIDVVALRGSARARRDIDELSGAVDDIERGPDYRVLSGSGAGGRHYAVVAVRVDARDAQSRAELPLEVIVDQHDARLDLHLPHGNVEPCHQAVDLLQIL